jgi:hypothetical protein
MRRRRLVAPRPDATLLHLVKKETVRIRKKKKKKIIGIP